MWEFADYLNLLYPLLVFGLPMGLIFWLITPSGPYIVPHSELVFVAIFIPLIAIQPLLSVIEWLE